MKIPKEARKASRELFRYSLVDGLLDQDRVRKVAKQLGESKPRYYLDILKDFTNLVRLELERRHAVVESAQELDEAGRQELEGTLRSRYGQDLTVEFKTTPSLLGGLRIKIGSDVFDSSVRERLNQLEAAAA